MSEKKPGGPKSVAGKMRSRANALKHGLTAKELLLPGEEKAYNRLRKHYRKFYQPRNVLEEHLVDSLAYQICKSQRLAKQEKSLITYLSHNRRDGDYGFRESLDPAVQEWQDDVRLGRAIQDMLQMNSLGQFSRADASQRRIIKDLCNDLDAILKARRQAEPALPGARSDQDICDNSSDEETQEPSSVDKPSD